MATINGKCGCGEENRVANCTECRDKEVFSYWCEVCGRITIAKRCPTCGLKARRIR